MENNRAYLLRMEITQSHLNNRICQHCGVQTSTVIPSFYYIFNISLPCNINIPSFIGNLWWVLLLGNHLNANPGLKVNRIITLTPYKCFCCFVLCTWWLLKPQSKVRKLNSKFYLFLGYRTYTEIFVKLCLLIVYIL